jgi:hypothetical protein
MSHRRTPPNEESTAASIPAFRREPGAARFRFLNNREGNAMSDQKTKCAPRDASLVNLENDDDVDYWIEKFGVTRDHLVFAVHRVGCSV